MKKAILVLCCSLFLVALVLIGWFCAKRKKDLTYYLEKADKEIEEYYHALKKDPAGLAKVRKELLEGAIEGCRQTRQRWNLAKLKNGRLVEKAFDGALEALRTGEIEDGVPRLVFAYVTPPPPPEGILTVIWVESDFDTTSIFFSSAQDSSNRVEQNVFENHNLEKYYLFSYYRLYQGKTVSIRELIREPQDCSYVLVKYVGENTPVLAPTLFGFGHLPSLYVPKGEFNIWLRDRAGNESNRLPVLKPTQEMLPKLPPLKPTQEMFPKYPPIEIQFK